MVMLPAILLPPLAAVPRHEVAHPAKAQPCGMDVAGCMAEQVLAPARRQGSLVRRAQIGNTVCILNRLNKRRGV